MLFNVAVISTNLWVGVTSAFVTSRTTHTIIACIKADLGKSKSIHKFSSTNTKLCFHSIRSHRIIRNEKVIMTRIFRWFCNKRSWLLLLVQQNDGNGIVAAATMRHFSVLKKNGFGKDNNGTELHRWESGSTERRLSLKWPRHNAQCIILPENRMIFQSATGVKWPVENFFRFQTVIWAMCNERFRLILSAMGWRERRRLSECGHLNWLNSRWNRFDARGEKGISSGETWNYETGSHPVHWPQSGRRSNESKEKKNKSINRPRGGLHNWTTARTQQHLPITSAFLPDVVNQASSPNLPNLYLERWKSLGKPQATETKWGFIRLFGSINVEKLLRNARVRARVVQQIDCILCLFCSIHTTLEFTRRTKSVLLLIENDGWKSHTKHMNTITNTLLLWHGWSMNGSCCWLDDSLLLLCGTECRFHLIFINFATRTIRCPSVGRCDRELNTRFAIDENNSERN